MNSSKRVSRNLPEGQREKEEGGHVWKGTEVRDAVAYSSERGRKYLKKSTALLNATENLRIMNTEKGI